MKKLAPLFTKIAAAVFLSLVLFFFSAPYSIAQKKISVIGNIPPYASLAETLAKDKVSVKSLASTDQDPHTFQVTPSKVKELYAADIYIYSGLSFELDLIERLKKQNPKIKIVEVNQGLPLLDVDQEGHADQHHGHEEETGDVHTYLSPTLLIPQAAAIYQALVEVDPANKDFYASNYLAFLNDVLRLRLSVQQTLKGVQGSTIYAFHGIQAYFALDFGLGFESLETDGKEVTPKKLEALLKDIKKSKVPVIFNSAPGRDNKAATFAKMAGVKLISVNHYDQDWKKGIENLAQALADNLKR